MMDPFTFFPEPSDADLADMRPPDDVPITEIIRIEDEVRDASRRLAALREGRALHDDTAQATN